MNGSVGYPSRSITFMVTLKKLKAKLFVILHHYPIIPLFVDSSHFVGIAEALHTLSDPCGPGDNLAEVQSPFVQRWDGEPPKKTGGFSSNNRIFSKKRRWANSSKRWNTKEVEPKFALVFFGHWSGLLLKMWIVSMLETSQQDSLGVITCFSWS